MVQPPDCKKIEKELTIHGDTRIDPYYWLNNREDNNVIDYLKAENSYKESMLKHTEKMQEDLFNEIVGRIKQDDSSVPYPNNGYYYYTRYEEGKEYPIHCRKKGNLEADEEIMLNVNKLAEPYSFYRASGLSVSPNKKLLAYGEDTLSRRIFTIRFKDLSTEKTLEDHVPNTTGSSVWASDNKTIFYTVKDKSLRPYKVFRHVLGTDPSEDVEVYHEKDSTYVTYCYKTKSDKYIVIGSFSTLSTEMRILRADDPTGEFRVFQPRERKHEYYIAHFDDQFYVRTNWDAQNYRLMQTAESSTGKDSWKEVIPHRKDILLENMEIFNDFLALNERKNGITQIRVMAEDSEHYIDFPEEAYVANISVNKEFDTGQLRLTYQSMTTPNSTFDYDMKERKLKLLKEQEVLGGFDKDNYKSVRAFATARDGEKVPISIVYRKDQWDKGQNPLMVYGYGSYGYSMEPFFSSVRLSLLDRGFVYAIAHIRGGEEMGRRWYEDGKLLNKKNTFTDFIDCTEYLVDQGYGKEGHVYAMGGSAGGLLMGAVVNMRPDLYKGIIAAVPFVDVVTTMLDESIPLTTGEYDEWGNPNDPKYYEYIKSYSPYDNVEVRDYPAMLITTGLHDSQVQYWEPAKWVAKLRDFNTGKEPILLHTNMEAGHGGASGRFRRHKETAMEYAFLFDLEGIDN